MSFKNCIIILTSNLGSNVIAKGGSKLGFEIPTESPEEAQYAQIKGLVMEEIRSYFKPEMLNRLDEVVVFRQLPQEAIEKICYLLLEEVSRRMADKGIGLQTTNSFMEKLCEDGYDKAYGARPLRRCITAMVEDYISDAMLKGELQSGDIARMDIDDMGDVNCTKVNPEEVEPEEIEIVYSRVVDEV